MACSSRKDAGPSGLRVRGQYLRGGYRIIKVNLSRRTVGLFDAWIQVRVFLLLNVRDIAQVVRSSLSNEQIDFAESIGLLRRPGKDLTIDRQLGNVARGSRSLQIF